MVITARAPEIDDDRILAVPCDQSDSDQVDKAFKTIESEIGPIEILVANAGITRDQLMLRMTDEDFANVINVNLTGTYRIARRAAKKMVRARWGRLIFYPLSLVFPAQLDR